MSYDIYGERLERGHCEVHPWVHQGYPCSVCMADYDRHKREKREQERMESKMRQDYEDEMIRAYTENQEGAGI